MYRFFVKLTFLIPAIAIAQGKQFLFIYLFIFERALPQSMIFATIKVGFREVCEL